jgi:hypothetical protein
VARVSPTNLLHAGGYGRVAITALIKAVLLCNRYVKNIGLCPIRWRHVTGVARRGAAANSANECLLELSVVGGFDSL